MNKKEKRIFCAYTSQGLNREMAFKKMKTQIAKEGTTMTPKEEQKHTALLPCPFCGGETIATKKQFYEGVGCDSCECGVLPSVAARTDELGNFNIQDAIATWNTRKADCHEELVGAFAKAFEDVKEQIRYYCVGNGRTSSENGRIIGLEDALAEFRKVMKLIERASATNHQEG